MNKQKTKEEVLIELQSFIKKHNKLLIVGSKFNIVKIKELIGENPCIGGNISFRDALDNGYHLKIYDVQDELNPLCVNHYFSLENCLYDRILFLLKGENTHIAREAIKAVDRNLDDYSVIK